MHELDLLESEVQQLANQRQAEVILRLSDKLKATSNAELRLLLDLYVGFKLKVHRLKKKINFDPNQNDEMKLIELTRQLKEYREKYHERNRE